MAEHQTSNKLITHHLPHNGQWHFPKKLIHDEVIIFVLFFAGKQEQLNRHIQLVNSLGYRAVTFSFSSYIKHFLNPFFLSQKHGLRSQWANEIEDVVDSVPGKKILFAFSGPAAGTIDVIARRKKQDINGLICDSGPFMKLFTCNWNLAKEHFNVKNKLLRLGVTQATCILWGVDHSKRLKRSVKNLPNNFPILSIRGWKDSLVPLEAIKAVFRKSGHLDLQVLNLPDGEHLDGLKNFPKVYSDKVSTFLKKISI